MLYSIVAGALAFNVGANVGGVLPARAPVVAMSMEGNFVYGAPVPASKGLPGFSGQTSFEGEMAGEVVPTATSKVTAMAGEFVYGSPAPASKGLPGFSSQASFSSEEATEALPPAAGALATAGKQPNMLASWVYGTPTPASKGLPGFSSQASFSGN